MITWPSAGETTTLTMPPEGQADAPPFVRRIPTPPLVGRQGNFFFGAHALTELDVFMEVPPVTTLKCWSWLVTVTMRQPKVLPT